MEKVLFTKLAADALDSLAAPVKQAVGEFLRDDLPSFASKNEPAPIQGLPGKFWVVQPAKGATSPTLVITRSAGNDGSFVVTSVLPETDANLAVGASIVNSVRAAY